MTATEARVRGILMRNDLVARLSLSYNRAQNADLVAAGGEETVFAR